MFWEGIAARSVMHIADHKAAGDFSRCHRSLGIAAVLVSALLGASIVEVIFGSDELGQVLTTMPRLTGARLTGNPKFLGPERPSNKDHAAVVGFDEHRREMGQFASFIVPVNLHEQLVDVKKKGSFALQAAPDSAHLHSWPRAAQLLDRGDGQ